MLYTKPKIITCNRTFFIFISTFSFIKNMHTYLKKNTNARNWVTCNYKILGCKGLNN